MSIDALIMGGQALIILYLIVRERRYRQGATQVIKIQRESLVKMDRANEEMAEIIVSLKKMLKRSK